jgi:hypothetical protein
MPAGSIKKAAQPKNNFAPAFGNMPDRIIIAGK